jgi:hypothetical protein
VDDRRDRLGAGLLRRLAGRVVGGGLRLVSQGCSTLLDRQD